MIALIVSLLLVLGAYSQAGSTAITFPASFAGPEPEKLNLYDIKNGYKKGIDAIQNVAGLMQNLLLRENVNFAAKNWVISPVSLAGIFAQILMGSRGEIREILSHALNAGDSENDYDKLDLHRQLGYLIRYLKHPADKDYILLLNAAVFLQCGFPLKATYKHALRDFYHTPIIPMDFRRSTLPSFRKINEWVRNSTYGRFTTLLSSPPASSTISIMANVMYFKGSWEIPFDPDYTQSGTFFIDNSRKSCVDFMHGEREILFGNTTEYQLIGIPFKSRDIFMYILLPNGKFSTRVAVRQFDNIAASARFENVSLVLPKVNIVTTISVKDAISMYLKESFIPLNELERKNSAPLPLSISSSTPLNHFDMSGASSDSRFKIDDIVHKVSFQMDEVGTEVVAVTSTLINHANNDFIVRVNRPFLFFVRHEPTLIHLFWGLVVNPSKSTTARNWDRN